MHPMLWMPVHHQSKSITGTNTSQKPCADLFIKGLACITSLMSERQDDTSMVNVQWLQTRHIQGSYYIGIVRGPCPARNLYSIVHILHVFYNFKIIKVLNEKCPHSYSKGKKEV